MPQKVSPVHASLGELEITSRLAVAEVVREVLAELRELLCMKQEPEALLPGQEQMGVKQIEPVQIYL